MLSESIDNKHETDSGLAEYAKSVIPENADVCFLFQEDFNGDNKDELLICVKPNRNWLFKVLYVYSCDGTYRHKWILTTFTDDTEALYSSYGALDAYYAADVTSDGKPDLVLGVTNGNGHFVNPIILYWKDGPYPVMWKYEEAFYRGELYMADTEDKDKGCFVMEKSTYDDTGIFTICEASPHPREAYIFKWDGETFNPHPYKVKEESYRAYNTGYEFLTLIYKKEYQKAYELILKPSFFGIEQLEKSSLEHFTEYAEKNITPVLERNKEVTGLWPDYDSFDKIILFRGIDGIIELGYYEDIGRSKIRYFSTRPLPQVGEPEETTINDFIIPGWIFSSVCSQMESPVLLEDKDVDVYTMIIKPDSNEHHILVIANVDFYDRVLIIFEKTDSGYNEVFSMKCSFIRSIQFIEPNIVLTIMDINEAGRLVYNYHILRYSPQGYKEVWKGLHYHHEIYQRTYNFQISAGLSFFPHEETFVYTRIKKRFKYMNPANTVKINKTYEIFKYNEATATYELCEEC